jgi:hypothetical protein
MLARAALATSFGLVARVRQQQRVPCEPDALRGK